ncbi:MAG: type II toxin-antitoxin system VapC family toxin [Bacteroidota bacterium]|nr:type II toxin-antitoxin system VapC family toxin [Bacteroidota bacterium]
MNQFLLDTNICIYFLKGKYNLREKFMKIGVENCFISEITLAELKYGVQNSLRKDENNKALEAFLSGVKILPIFHSLDLYAIEKARLRKNGTPVDDFDLLIAVSAVHHNLIMVTHNRSHFEKVQKIILEDWVA